MGRKKIQIQRITDERNRQVTFTKRKFGLMKKAYELSVLCDCEIALIIFNHSNKLFQYASTDMDKVLLKYTEYNEPHESRTNADIIETLRKKGFNGCDSPEPDGDDSIDQSSLNEDKYCKASEDLDILFKRYGSAVPPPTFSMPVTVPVSNQNALQFTTGGPLVTTSFAPSSLSDPRLLSPQQSALQRNTVSPGLPQRPASAGALLGGDLNSSNGACPSPVGNGYISARASPGLSVSNGNSLGKIAPAKSPPPPSSQMGINSRKPDLRVITPSKGLIQLTDEDLELNAQRLGGSQVTQPLTTPVVSVATPSLLTQGLPFSAMPTAYNAEYQLTSADLSALQAFSSPSSLSLGNISTWQQQQAQQQATQQQQQLSLASLSNLVPSCHLPQNTSLTVNTNPVSIKSEPVSPNRDRSTPCSSATGSGLGGTQYLRQDPTGRSPVDSLSSNGSSYEGSDRDDPGHQQRPQDFGCSLSVVRPSGDTDQDNSGVKRKRLDAWVT
ncbi:myocyte-specific enhancer factor 2D isoform X1 [Polypterus senegalus]|uniref:myocyte-specific enhancer factor 2D isoform X1 n=2 Tax=Polypterus senegalus TaxID=55291 RepID=UPI001964DD28|nr:myocyte-specific enhancer factor 2D isoform X1 [Polypterus senegalus]XP_039607019.1 myocyte-specific enhancer factor 2D isoform X1 [Polypterus senegalus]XP_039607028.1 myocyte-specific enhancer factor 2D isoform X1 [Polypterus senegalus]